MCPYEHGKNPAVRASSVGKKAFRSQLVNGLGFGFLLVWGFRVQGLWVSFLTGYALWDSYVKRKANWLI